MLIKKPTDIKPSEITPEGVYRRRREFIKASAALGLGAGLGFSSAVGAALSQGPGRGQKIAGVVDTDFGQDLELTSYKDITSYNNFYEFGTDKGDPARAMRHTLKPRPWSVVVDGECDAPGEIGIEDVLKGFHPGGADLSSALRRGLGRMVVPWVGFPLADLLKRFKPNSKANYVMFETLYDPEQMPGRNAPCSTGLTARACAWTRRCIR
jgi:sulfoxide reductase catalytic subunit YedY